MAISQIIKEGLIVGTPLPATIWATLSVRWCGNDYEVREADNMALCIKGPKITPETTFVCGEADSPQTMKLRALMACIDTEDRTAVDAEIASFLDTYVISPAVDVADETKKEESEEEEEEEDQTEKEAVPELSDDELLAQFLRSCSADLQKAADMLDSLAEGAIMSSFCWANQKDNSGPSWIAVYKKIKNKAAEMRRAIQIRKNRHAA